MVVDKNIYEGKEYMAALRVASRRIGGHPSLQTYLQGKWVFNRKMTHTDNGTSLGSVDQATAIFAPVAVKEKDDKDDDEDTTTTTTTTTTSEIMQQNQLLYREEGNVIFAQSTSSTPLPFYREYLYSFKSTTTADVSFWRPGNVEEHLKFFHTLQVSEEGIGATSEHLCIDDLYVATINVASDCTFIATWVVEGPNKQYTITTEFTRDERKEE